MSTSITDRGRYICLFVLFSLIFCLLLSLLTLLGIRSDGDTAAMSDGGNAQTPTVVIDAGHGGEDAGAIGSEDVYEKDINLSIALMLSDILRASGVNTVLTRSEDILLYDKNSNYKGQKKVQDLAARKRIAEEYENAVFVSIHMNAFPEERYSGLQVYYSKNHEDSQVLAEAIQALTREKLLPTNDRSPKAADSSIYLLHKLSCPAVMVECGFLSNAEECKRLADIEYQRQLALCIAASVINYVDP